MITTQHIYCLNETGGRKQNEDSVWPKKGTANSSDRLFMVCDGVGGGARGEVASALTCEGFAEYFKTNLGYRMPDDDFVNEARLFVMDSFSNYFNAGRQQAEEAASKGDANDIALAHAYDERVEQMATTLTLAYLNVDSVFVAWCGDSRIYQIRNGEIVFESKDHSLLNELIDSGNMTEEEAQNFSQRNVIVRAIQQKKPYAKIDCTELDNIADGDFIMLCSDGLLENITKERIREILSDNQPKNIIDSIQQLCSGNTKDNYSMYLLQLSNPAKPLSQSYVASDAVAENRRRPKGIFFVSLFIVFFAAIGIVFGLFRDNSKNQEPVKAVVDTPPDRSPKSFVQPVVANKDTVLKIDTAKKRTDSSVKKQDSTLKKLNALPKRDSMLNHLDTPVNRNNHSKEVNVPKNDSASKKPGLLPAKDTTLKDEPAKPEDSH